MSRNILDTDQFDKEGNIIPFQLTLRNPNPRASHLKSGMRYTVEFELVQHEWQDFADAHTAGMVIECVGTVTHRNVPEDSEDQLKGGPRSKHAAMLCNNPDFFSYITTETYFDVDFAKPMSDECRSYLLEVCKVTSRRYLDHDTQAAIIYDDIVGTFTRWIEDDEKTAQV